MNERPTWPAPEIKVRKETNVPYLKFGKNTQQKIRRIRKLFVGSKMARNQKRQNNAQMMTKVTKKNLKKEATKT